MFQSLSYLRRAKARKEMHKTLVKQRQQEQLIQKKVKEAKKRYVTKASNIHAPIRTTPTNAPTDPQAVAKTAQVDAGFQPGQTMLYFAHDDDTELKATYMGRTGETHSFRDDDGSGVPELVDVVRLRCEPSGKTFEVCLLSPCLFFNRETEAVTMYSLSEQPTLFMVERDTPVESIRLVVAPLISESFMHLVNFQKSTIDSQHPDVQQAIMCRLSSMRDQVIDRIVNYLDANREEPMTESALIAIMSDIVDANLTHSMHER